jgi:GT2 family glycosyltransferase
VKFSVIMACHNRKALTLRAIERAQVAADGAVIKIAFTVFDDGSTDGTSEALSAMPHTIRVLHGDGTAYWARSMALAETAALESGGRSPNEFIVWLNDDVILDKTAFLALRQTIDQNPDTVIVGAMRDPSTGALTYSGMRRNGLHPLNFGMILPSKEAQPVETFNGNLVVVPVPVARLLGGIDGYFSHAFADIDYGLRCDRVGISVLLAPGTLGMCRRNPISSRRTAREDWRAFTGRKGGGNFRSLRRILRKSNSRSWLLVVAASYGLWWARRVAPTSTPHAAMI